jgi:hypothetical protein
MTHVYVNVQEALSTVGKFVGIGRCGTLELTRRALAAYDSDKVRAKQILHQIAEQFLRREVVDSRSILRSLEGERGVTSGR